MMHYQMNHWTPIKEPPTLGMTRLRYAAGLAMVSFFVSSILAWPLTFEVMLPFMVASLICWAVLGSASRKNRASSIKPSVGRFT